MNFKDPRGPRTPFEPQYTHHPHPGQMVTFPSWLMVASLLLFFFLHFFLFFYFLCWGVLKHEIGPTVNNELARVSVAFNWGSSWDETVNSKDLRSEDFQI